MKQSTLLLFIPLLIAQMHAIASENNLTKSNINNYLTQLVEPSNGIGARPAGSIKEKQTATFIHNVFMQLGYHTQSQAFDLPQSDKQSANIIADSYQHSLPTIVVAAHYDSTGEQKGSLGATDNGAGVAAMLAIAEKLSANKPKNYNIRYIAFGAEENGLIGSIEYINELKRNQPDDLKRIIAMINFDTIAGGDVLYVHSAPITPYECDGDPNQYNSDTWLRDAVIKSSAKILGSDNQFVLHPAYPGYPEGVTGAWSDHAPFACQGIPIAYIEATNFAINGSNGYDGYSQSTHTALWDCYDAAKMTACDRQTETQWGNIWHTKFDRLAQLEQLFPGRINQQISHHVNVISTLLADFPIPD